MKNGWLTKVLFTVALAYCAVTGVAAASVEVGRTNITYTAQGSPNTIAGSWSTSAMSVAPGATVDFFEVEFSSFTSAFGSPESVSFVSSLPGNTVGLYFCDTSRNSSCVASPISGALGQIHQSDQAWAFVSRLLDGATYPTSGNVGVSFSSGGGYTQAVGELKITAMGLAAPVPEPSAWAMALMGIGVIALVRKNASSKGTQT